MGSSADPQTEKQDGDTPLSPRATRRSPRASRPSPLVIGLVGGIGSGKSSVATEFAQRGARIISGDELGHEALRQREIREKVVNRWGTGILDEKGEIARHRLGDLVFADPRELKALEAMVHPWIGERLRQEAERLRNDAKVPLIVVDAAVMLEAGWHRVCDKLVFVDAPEEERGRRVAERRGWTAAQLQAREARQMALTDKASRADHTIHNSGSLEHLGRQVDDLLRLWGVSP